MSWLRARIAQIVLTISTRKLISGPVSTVDLTHPIPGRYDPSRSSSWTSSATALDYKFENPYAHPGPRTAQQADDVDSPQSPTLIDIDSVIGTEQIKDPRQDREARSIVVVQSMTDADGGNSRARFERGSAGFWGLGIDPVSRTIHRKDNRFTKCAHG